MTKETISNIETKRHSYSHVLAAAVLDLFPEAKLGIGPAIENGFYYDFEFKKSISEEDLQKIEKKMREIIVSGVNFKKEIKPLRDAEKLLKSQKQSYKLDLLKDLEKAGEKKVSFFESGNFIDLCAGPHVSNSRELNTEAFKLISIAGAYWKGSEKNKMLTRIYGLAFISKKELDNYLEILEEAEKRDHRKLGRKLDLFSLPEELGGGLPVWHPKGSVLRNQIEIFWKNEHQKRGYNYVYTPHLGNINLWKKSGHWDFYRENLYSPMDIDDEEYLIKPMNCPFHIMVYKSKLRSYRDLPIRYCELGTVYRYEKSGVLHGLTRVRGFTQDDAHIFCRSDQLESEIISVIKLADFMMKKFGFKYKAYLSTKPEKAIGSEKNWEIATKALKDALKKTKTTFEIDPGEGVFYGPKIDIKLEDALGRQWQGPTIQVDFNFPEKFDLKYIDEKGERLQPIMIHRTVLGSMERFIGVLIEHYGGVFPLWLAPEQIRVVTVSDKVFGYAQKLKENLEKNGFRVGVDLDNETVSKKIREAEMEKMPYIVVVGEKEVKSNKLAVRKRGDKKIQEKSLEEFIIELKKEL